MTIIKRCKKEVQGTWADKQLQAATWLDYFVPLLRTLRVCSRSSVSSQTHFNRGCQQEVARRGTSLRQGEDRWAADSGSSDEG